MLQLEHRHLTNIVRANQALTCLTWAPYTPVEHQCFSTPIMAILNHTFDADIPVSMETIRESCQEKITGLGLDPATSIMLLTSVPQTYMRQACCKDEVTGLEVQVFCTSGLGNALAPGDPTTYNEEVEQSSVHMGTINIIVVINRNLTQQAMLELSQVVTMAKCQALYYFGKKSALSNRVALGTGTDCLVIAGFETHPTTLRYGGMHVKLSELVARATEKVVHSAITAQHSHLLRLQTAAK